MNKSGRPIGSFLFVGPTGVGKTETAKQLAQDTFLVWERLVIWFNRWLHFGLTLGISAAIQIGMIWLLLVEAGQLTEQSTAAPLWQSCP